MHKDYVAWANTKRNEYLLKTEELFKSNKNRWITDFSRHLRDICVRIRKSQDELTLSAISNMEYTMLYTNFINRRYVVDIFVYGDKCCLDKNQRMIGEYDVSFLFVYFDELWNKLISERKYYVGKVKALEVSSFVLGTLSDFYQYLATITRHAIVEVNGKNVFADIEKNEIFKVNVGDYMSKTETVYAENKNKNEYKLTEWFGERLVDKYVFGDYSSLDFSNNVFLYTDFRFAQFECSTFKNANFEGSSLLGANFRNTNMENCCLDFCSIHEADFYNAMLKNASFKNAQAKFGLTDEKEWQFQGFLPTSFRNANLICADFTGANLTGADFTGANLTGADFTGAELTGIDFTDAILDNAIFDARVFTIIRRRSYGGMHMLLHSI